MKRLVLCVVAVLAFAGCSSGGPSLGVHPKAKPATTAKPAAMTKPAPRVPLTLSIAGVRFDALTRAEALAQLEKRGFTLIKKRQLCDRLDAPQHFDRAAWVLICWYGPRWAWTRLQWTSGSSPRRFYALAHALIHQYGQPSSHDLHPLYANRADAAWAVEGGRGAVRIEYNLKMHLTIEDVRASRALVDAVKRAQARRTAHQAAGVRVGGR